MRISTSMFHDFSVRSMQARQEAVFKAQSELSTGKKINSPSDAPVDALRVLERTQSLNRITQFERNLGLAKQNLQQQDSLFGEVVDLLQGARDLAIQMNSGAMTNENRRHAALVLRDQLDHLMGLANSRDPTGSYMFSGFMGTTQAFTVDDATGEVIYNGDPGQRKVWVAEGRTALVADDGDSLFMQIPGGNGTFTTAPVAGNRGTGTIDGGNVVDPRQWLSDTYSVTFKVDPVTKATTYSVTDSAGNPVLDNGVPPSPLTDRAYQPSAAIQFNGIQFVIKGDPADGDGFSIGPSENRSVFSTIKALADALDAGVHTAADRAGIANSISSFITNIDQSLDHFTGARAKAGDRLNALEAVEAAHQSNAFLNEQTISALQDTDYAEAVSRLTRNMQALEAAQKAYGTTKDLSLFRYL